MSAPAAPTDPDGPTQVVHAAVAGGVATLTLDSPGNRNALSAALVDQLSRHLDAAAADPAVRAVVLTHTGSTFCAGADLAEMAAEGGPAASTARLVALLRRIVELPKPVAALVDGHVRAGGVGVLGACDVVVAGPASTFAFTEVRIGVAPAMISLTVLSRLTDRAASRYLLTGETFGPEVAAHVGLVTEAAADPVDALDAVLGHWRACSPQGLAETKALTTRAVLDGFDASADDLAALSARLFASDEGQEGIAAFRERRPPRWVVPG
jgi:enoyl-CoA hydratase